MLIREAGARLVSMLADSGVAPGAVTAADVRTIVEVFRRFAAIPADDAAPAERYDDSFAPLHADADECGVVLLTSILEPTRG